MKIFGIQITADKDKKKKGKEVKGEAVGDANAPASPRGTNLTGTRTDIPTISDPESPARWKND